MDALDIELPWPRYFSKRKASDYSGKTFTAGDTLFARITPCTENGKAALVPEIETQVGIGSTEFAVLSPNRERVLPWYLFYVAKSHPVHNYAVSRMRGSTGRQRVPFSVFRRELDVALPPFEEQRKIATVLYTVDQAIEKTEEIISQLGRTKQGLYRTLFSEGYKQHIQFQSTNYGKIPESWNVSKITEVTSQIQAGGTPDTDVPEYYDGGIPWVKTGELSQYRVTETKQKITERGLEESTARLFSPETILIAMYGATTGEVSLLEIEAATNQACCGIVTTDEMVPKFLFHQLNYLSNRLESLSAGSGQQNISKSIIEKFDILVPPIEEQNSIADVLNSVDDSIAKNESTEEHYQRLKQGLMQNLLSGEVRTRDKNIEVVDDVIQYG
jgi:type I restriction enzyme S subunit